MCCSCREPEEWFCYVTFKKALTFRILPCFLFQGVEQRKEMVESKEQWSWGWAQIKLLKFPILSSDRSSLINSFFLGWICTLHHPEKPGVSRCANLLGGKRSKMSSESKLFSTCFYFIPILVISRENHLQDAERERKSSQKRRSPPPAPRYLQKSKELKGFLATFHLDSKSHTHTHCTTFFTQAGFSTKVCFSCSKVRRKISFVLCFVWIFAQIMISIL